MSSAAATTHNACDFKEIYNERFQYCVPEGVVRSFFEGNSFGRTEPYSPTEQRRLTDDINTIYGSILTRNPIQEKLAVISAGAPGAGKTTIIRQQLEEYALRGKQFAYIDPDDVCLKEMKQTWAADLEKSLRYADQAHADDRIAQEKQIRENGYDKWRPGSNAANHLILANLIRQNYAFYFGTTSSSPLTANTFKYLKEKGYRIHLIHVIAPDDVRWNSIRKRDKSFVQTTEDDTIEKGRLVPQRINDTYLKYADQIDFYFRGEVKEDATLTATWIRSSKEESTGELKIFEQEMYRTMVRVHNEICATLEEPDDTILWENSVIKASISSQ